MEGGIGRLLGGIFMRGNKSNFWRHSALVLSLLLFSFIAQLIAYYTDILAGIVNFLPFSDDSC